MEDKNEKLRNDLLPLLLEKTQAIYFENPDDLYNDEWWDIAVDYLYVLRYNEKNTDDPDFLKIYDKLDKTLKDAYNCTLCDHCIIADFSNKSCKFHR